MRIARPDLLLLLFLLVPGVLNAQQGSAPAPRDTQAVALLQRSLTAFVGTNTIKDVTLSGSANWIAGSDEESGSATLKATAVGQGRVDLTLSGGQRIEVADITQAPPVGSWCGPDGVWHSAMPHNLFTDPTWFFPAFLINRALSSTSYAISPADAEVQNGVSVEHVAVYLQGASADPSPAVNQGLSRTDVYLNASTLLPVSVSFNTHPDSNSLVNIPVQINFSNYQAVQGASAVPYHIQKYIQNSLVLDVTLSSVQANLGLSGSDFQAH